MKRIRKEVLVVGGIGLAVFAMWTSIGRAPVKSAPGTASSASTSAAVVAQAPSAVSPNLPSRAVDDTLLPASQPERSTNIMDTPAGGDRAIAAVSYAGRKYSLQPTQYGFFDRVLIEPSAKVPVQVTYPDGEPGEKVIVEVEDGGQLDNDSILAVQALDDEKRLAFVFQATDQTGIFRVTLRKGGDVKTLNFWAGPELPIAAAR
ncbi:MAG TPA: hypothetical protein VIT91_20850 [Chthoniobacterales bacterium]